jgi:hypothetical protein
MSPRFQRADQGFGLRRYWRSSRGKARGLSSYALRHDPGTIESVGTNAIEDESAAWSTWCASGSPAQRLRGGKTVLLSPGMAVTADIRTGQRMVLSYLVNQSMKQDYKRRVNDEYSLLKLPR